MRYSVQYRTYNHQWVELSSHWFLKRAARVAVSKMTRRWSLDQYRIIRIKDQEVMLWISKPRAHTDNLLLMMDEVISLVNKDIDGT